MNAATRGPRLASVDVLRGLAVAAMLLVNNPGDWGHVYWPLEHSAWNGCTPTDLIYPLFLFVVGVSCALGLAPGLAAGAAPARLGAGVVKRALRIVALGLVLHALAWWLMDKPAFRPMGVLQRIGLCYAAVGLLALYVGERRRWALLAALLLGYGLLLQADGTAAMVGSLAQRIDTAVLGHWAYEWDAARGIGFDPEGLLSTLGALGTTLLGLQCGELLRRERRVRLLAVGAAAMLLGWLWSAWLPFNKQLWTPSFVLWTGGLATLALAGAHAWVDLHGGLPWGRAFGRNAMAAYAGAWICTVLLEGFGWMAPLYGRVFAPLGAWVGPYGQSLAFALAFVAVWAAIVTALDRRGLYWRI